VSEFDPVVARAALNPFTVNPNPGERVAELKAHLEGALDALEGATAVVKDYESWIEEACEALGVKTVFEFKDAGLNAERKKAKAKTQ
jgi:hypothetical protein